LFQNVTQLLIFVQSLPQFYAIVAEAFKKGLPKNQEAVTKTNCL